MGQEKLNEKEYVGSVSREEKDNLEWKVPSSWQWIRAK